MLAFLMNKSSSVYQLEDEYLLRGQMKGKLGTKYQYFHSENWKEKGEGSIQLFHKLTLGSSTLDLFLPTYSLPTHLFFCLQFLKLFSRENMTHNI